MLTLVSLFFLGLLIFIPCRIFFDTIWRIERERITGELDPSLNYAFRWNSDLVRESKGKGTPKPRHPANPTNK